MNTDIVPCHHKMTRRKKAFQSIDSSHLPAVNTARVEKTASNAYR